MPFEPPLLLVLDGPTRAHLARAVETHRRWCRVNAVPVPGLFHQLSVVLAATDGQGRTELVGAVPAADSGPMALTYKEAAQLLSVSERTVRRLITGGELVAVTVGGCRRVSRQAITEYLSALEETTHGTTPAA